MARTYRLDLAGPVPGAVADQIRRRFGDVTIRALPPGTVLDGSVADQAALRALLGLLWDVGSEVRLLQVTDDDP
jgi:hypothetical protein